MNDLNFFIDPNAKKNKSSTGLVLIATIAVVALFVVGLFGFWAVRNNRVKNEIVKIEAQIASPEYQQGKMQVDLLNQRLNLLNQYDQSLNQINAFLYNHDPIKKAFMDTIALTIPKDITLVSFNLNSRQMSLEAFSANETANAELIKNLKDTGLFKTVDLNSAIHSDTVNAAPTDRNIVINAMLKEVLTK